MDIIIESTKNFEKDLEKFSNTDQSTIIEKINRFFQLLSTDKASFYRRLYRFPNLKLINNYESSLYSLKINPIIRIILTIDDDPIFGRTIITLFRVVKSSELSNAYKLVAESLYKDLTLEKEKVEVHSN